MKSAFSHCLILAFILFVAACSSAPPFFSEPEASLALSAIFPTPERPGAFFNASIIASPQWDTSHSKPRLLVPAANGTVAALDAETGTLLWRLEVPHEAGQEVQLAATPVVTADKWVLLYQCLDKGVRVRHQMVVIDLKNQRLDPAFPPLVFAAELPATDSPAKVKFNASTAYSHAALTHLPHPEGLLGLVYAGFGNAGDVQPFHGWVFEIDLDAWWQKGVEHAVKNVLLTTPETHCPAKMEYGTQEMVCGGGVWVPAGPLLAQGADGMELFIPTGNGQVDLMRHDYANALLRVRPGLKFDAACDAGLCADFNPLQPKEACLASCKNLFIPRLVPGNAPLKPPNHECDHKDFWECLAWMDYDLGGNTPVKITLDDGRAVLLQTGKDGGAYLLDAAHLGKQYDRLQIAPVCGSANDLCKLSWAGMIVTHPVQTRVDGQPVVVIPTFNADQTHASGLVALKIVSDHGQPKLRPFWQFPAPNSPDALNMFRSHPSFPLLAWPWGKNGDAVVWLVDVGAHGTLYGIRVRDGRMVAKQTLQGTGRQLSMPLMAGDVLYLVSKMPDAGKALIEAFHIKPAS